VVLVSAVVGTVAVVAGGVGLVVFVTTCKDDPVIVLFGVTLRIAAENALEAIKILEEAIL